MLKKIAIGGAIAAAIVGSGTAAIAMSGSDSSAATPGSSSTSTTAPAASGSGSKAGDKAGDIRKALGKSALHGSVVTREKGSTTQFVTHDGIRGMVTAVSPTSITIKAADNTSETFVVNSATKVRQRTNGKVPPARSAPYTPVTMLSSSDGHSTMTATGVIDVTK